MTIVRRLPLASCLLLIPAPDAHAAGGAHVIDDAVVEDPGTCNAETWASIMAKGSAQFTASAACTPHAVPWLEAGIWVQHTWIRGHDDIHVGPAAKVAALRLAQGMTVGAAVWSSWSGATNRIESAGGYVPLTVELSGDVSLNFNAGWEWARTGDRHKAIVGAQVDWLVSSDLSLMVEGFSQIGVGPGYQAGVRWMPASWIDIDLLVGRLSDGRARRAATLGVTVRY